MAKHRRKKGNDAEARNTAHFRGCVRLSDFVVECEIEADGGPQIVRLLVTACDDDEAGDRALWLLERGRIADVRPAK